MEPVRKARLATLLGRFWSSSLASELEYPLNVAVEVLAVAGNLAGSLFVLSLFFGEGRSLGGWSWPASLVVLGCYTLLEGFTVMLLQPNLSRIVSHVQNGTLDFVLLKPLDSQLWVSLRLISPWGLPSILAGASLIGVGLARSGGGGSLATAAASLLMLLCSTLILYSLWFLLATTSIWFVKVWNATEVLRALLMAGRYPISAFPSGLRLVFTFLLPVAFLTTVPAEALLGRASLSWLSGALAMAAALLLISRLFWRFALRFYTSASS
ncbi:ABC transporter permease [Synechococcus sp. RSCCF101]|uniref:ABC transporter permease n=1 Tax=Synechococcus sp. RSCCF101 TaxID=2511069 RepID=UPI00124639AB|nr:ABC-2 family transporter protein [Synechococcus sp. RSCCF101]QEY31286.1 ABC transporter permease [Synechococcus sp. RSCCF101]